MKRYIVEAFIGAVEVLVPVVLANSCVDRAGEFRSQQAWAVNSPPSQNAGAAGLSITSHADEPGAGPAREDDTTPDLARCELHAPVSGNVDLMLVNLSLHHGAPSVADCFGKIDAPRGPQVLVAARYLRRSWVDPDTLVVVIPSGPNICSETGTRAALFRDMLSVEYGGYAFDFSVTGESNCPGFGANTQAVIAGKKWKITSTCPAKEYPPNLSNSEANFFGDFELRSVDHGISFHVLATQTQCCPGNPILEGQLRFLLDYAVNHRGTEPTFIVGDFNWPQGHPDLLLDSPLGWQLRRNTNWLNCNRACQPPLGQIAFNVQGNDPSHMQDDMEILQANGDTRLTLSGLLVHIENGDPNGNLHPPGIAHEIQELLFRVEPSPRPANKTCPALDTCPSGACGSNEKCIVSGNSLLCEKPGCRAKSDCADADICVKHSCCAPCKCKGGQSTSVCMDDTDRCDAVCRQHTHDHDPAR